MPFAFHRFEWREAALRGDSIDWDGLDSADGKAEKLGFFQAALDDFTKAFERIERLASVTPDDIVRVAKTYLEDSSRTIIVAEPKEPGAASS